MKNLDLYKVIILLSLLALPAVGGWGYWLQGQLDEGRTAIANATRAGGELEQIGKFQKAVEEQRRAAVTQQAATPDNFEVYFDRAIQSSQSGQSLLKRTDFRIIEAKSDRAGNNADDKLVEIRFRAADGDDKPLPRSFLLAMLYNSEASSPLWKLRELTMTNADESAIKVGRNKAPPPELEDTWKVNKLVFASRQPSN